MSPTSAQPTGDNHPLASSPVFSGVSADDLDHAPVMPGATVNRIVAYIEDRLGQGAVDRLLELARYDGDRRDFDDLNRFHTYGTATALLRAACSVLAVPDSAREIGEARGMSFERLPSPAATTLYEVTRSFRTPREAMQAIPLMTPRFAPGQHSEIVEVTDDGGTVAFSPLGVPDARDRKLWCAFTAGMLAAPSQALGFHVEVIEQACEADGAERCRFGLRWWPTPEDPEPQIEAVRRHLELATRQVQLLEEMPGETLSDVDLGELLERIVDRAGNAVLASSHVLVVRRDEGDQLSVHSRGVDPGDVDAMAAAFMAGAHRADNRLVADVATSRRFFGRLAAIRAPGEPEFFPEERRMLDAFAKAAAAALEVGVALDRARELALRDELTGLPNRRLFEDRLGQALSLARRRCLTGAVVAIDIEGFDDIDGLDNVNLTRGHRAGDALMMQVGRRLATTLRSSDTVSRLAVDEFAILLPEIHDADALDRITARLCSVFDESFIVDDTPIPLRVSVGVASFPSTGDTVRQVLTRADIALGSMKDALRDSSWWSGSEGIPDV